MNKIKIYKRILIHFLFWGGFVLLFYLQNQDATTVEYLYFIGKLFIISLVVYFNIFVLFPRYFNKKKFKQYTVFLILIIAIGALSLIFIYRNSKSISPFLSFLQYFLNIILFVIITSWFELYRDNIRKQIHIKNLENIQLNTELSMLKSQINPHFLFNSLNNLYGLILQNKNQIAAQNILRLSELMRYVLDSSTHNEVALSEDIRFINNYLSLEKIRLSDSIDIQFETSLDNDDIKIPPLLFIPMIENTFKHGIEHHTKEGFAHFSLSVQGNELFFEAKNSLSNISINKEQVSGTGLINLQRRLEILYPGKHSLSIEKNKKTYRIVLILNL